MADSFEDSLARIRAIGENINRLLGESGQQPNEPRDLTLFGLTLEEGKGWLANLPDFTKRIVTSLHGKRPPDKLPVYP